jgi:hypothetical protein
MKEKTFYKVLIALVALCALATVAHICYAVYAYQHASIIQLMAMEMW